MFVGELNDDRKHGLGCRQPKPPPSAVTFPYVQTLAIRLLLPGGSCPPHEPVDAGLPRGAHFPFHSAACALPPPPPQTVDAERVLRTVLPMDRLAEVHCRVSQRARGLAARAQHNPPPVMRPVDPQPKSPARRPPPSTARGLNIRYSPTPRSKQSMQGELTTSVLCSQYARGSSRGRDTQLRAVIAHPSSVPHPSLVPYIPYPQYGNPPDYMQLLDLPADILVHILSLLVYSDLWEVRMVNRALCHAAARWFFKRIDVKFDYPPSKRYLENFEAVTNGIAVNWAQEVVFRTWLNRLSAPARAAVQPTTLARIRDLVRARTHSTAEDLGGVVARLGTLYAVTVDCRDYYHWPSV
ncbi:hypothetical protein HYPSUDRAFT_213157 [Hypholoma sublateritium FD-334 SS-4]|uniref:F-box domain-containing protein n=1 Tax=Hypholoma sublateritium (strain FD-334 SS-4) TaxID=945553 RepID=A0A0D2LG28_HYPSF|nr:hypothetical protein HYPSUDRAFT_213157 [Hypholoma sublateritium FD-334 SS-4]